MTADRITVEQEPSPACVPVFAVPAATLHKTLDAAGPLARAYAGACHCDAEPGSVLLEPGADGAVERVLFDIQAADAAARALYDLLKARYVR